MDGTQPRLGLAGNPQFPGSALDVADQVVLLELGRILWAGPRPDLQQEQLTVIYLGCAQQAVAATVTRTVLGKRDA